MKGVLRVIICGNYGATNLGDEAILQTIVRMLRSTYPRMQLKVVSANPELTARQNNVETLTMIPSGLRSLLKTFFSGRLFQTLRAYRRANLVIFGGGGLLTDEKPQAIVIWMMQILPALVFGKKVFCFGQSVGPLKRGWSRWVVRKIFRRIRVITVRDAASQDLLLQLGIVNVVVVPDPVFGFLANIHDRPRQPYIVFSLRTWVCPVPHTILAQFIDWIYQTHQLKTFLVPFQTMQDDDSKELHKVFLELQNKNAAELKAYNGNVSEVLQLMREATAVVGMRLHALIFSAITNTPFLALSYSQKVAEVVRQLGMEDFLCDYRSLELEDLKKKFEKLLREAVDVEKKLADHQKIFAEKTSEYLKLLEKFST